MLMHLNKSIHNGPTTYQTIVISQGKKHSDTKSDITNQEQLFEINTFSKNIINSPLLISSNIGKRELQDIISEYAKLVKSNRKSQTQDSIYMRGKSSCRKHNIHSRQPPEQHKTKTITVLREGAPFCKH